MPQNRFYVQILIKGVWEPLTILCQFKDVRKALKYLKVIAKKYSVTVNELRLRRLLTTEEIADAKLAVYRRKDATRNRRKRNDT